MFQPLLFIVALLLSQSAASSGVEEAKLQPRRRSTPPYNNNNDEVQLTPKWPVTYQMNQSTIVMVCNYSGYMSDDVLPKLARYGIVDIDWSNAKALWANTAPMDCQQRLLTQVQAIKELGSSTRVFVYRNLAKALPWFSDVREKLLDPAYNKYWFLPFKPAGPYHMQPCIGTGANEKCSMFYHDNLQTPSYPSVCTPNQCDCGVGLPCGEYVYDHRNASLRQWLTDVFVMGDANGTGVSNPLIDGTYIDDGWTDHQSAIAPWQPPTGFCDHNKYGGVTEEDYECVLDMNLSASAVSDLTQGWKQSMQMAQNAQVAAGAWNWQLFHAVGGSPNATQCAGWMRGEGMKLVNTTMRYQYTQGSDMTQAQFEVDLAIFLLTRGDYAWLGYTWDGCHSKWAYQWNAMLDGDYGHPLQEQMVEIRTGVFQRQWSQCVVQMDCNAYKPSFNFAAAGVHA